MVLLLISVSDVGPNNLKHQIDCIYFVSKHQCQCGVQRGPPSSAANCPVYYVLLFRAIPICSIIRAFIYPRLSDLTCFCRLQAAMCYVHVAALVAEYLRRKGTSVFCDGNVSPAY